MALFRSPLFADIRGSIGGTTFSRTRGGSIARNRTNPINPNTTRQAAVRADLNNLAFIFNTFDRSTVEAWNEVAASYPTKNKLGEEYVPSGKQLFISCGLNLRSINVLTNPILPSAAPAIPQCDISLAVATAEESAGILENLGIQNVTSDLPTAKILVRATPNLPAARGANTNRMRQITNATQALPIDLFPSWTTVFGTPPVAAGQIINLSVAAVHPTNGLSSAWFFLRTIIAPV